MYKILYIVSSLKKSGPTMQLFNLVNNLDKLNYKPVIMTLSRNPEESMLEDFITNGIEVIQKPENNFIFSIKKYEKLILNLRPNLIHTSGIRADRIGAKINLNIPTVSTIHNYMFLDYVYGYGYFIGNIMAYLHIKYLTKIDKPITCSASIKKMYLDKIGINFTSIPNGIDMTNFTPVEQKDIFKIKLGLPLDKKIIIATGHLSKLKDPITICEGFINSKFKDSAFLIFLGNGELKKVIENNYAHYNIKIMGRVTNVSDYLKASDYFISGSHTEGMPNAVLEAMATNLPLILSNILPHREIIEDNQSQNVLFEVGNYKSLVTKIDEILKYSPNIKINNRNVVQKRYTNKVMAGSYQEEYFKVLDKINI